MGFIRFFVDRPITSLMIYAGLGILGILSFFRMPVELMPGGESNILSIIVGIRGGLPPEDAENLIIKPIEEEMATLYNLEEINSIARKERATVSLTFKIGTDTSRSALEVQERMAKIKGKLPREIEKPIISRYDESQAPILILAMSSKHFTPEEMRDVAENQLKPLLKRVDGVANIEIGGGRQRKILVEFDKNRLEAYGLPIRQVIAQIGAENINALSGRMESDREFFLVRTVGAYRSVEEISSLPVSVTKEGSRIQLSDLAEIKDYYLEPDSHSRMNREPVVSTYIQKEAQANTIVTAERIRKAAEDFKKTLDPKINFTTVSDQSVVIQKALDNVWSQLMQGGALAALVLIILLRDFLSSSYIFVAIPLCTLVTLVFMKLFNLHLNVMTISALAISAGMVVDSSICVLETIVSMRSKAMHAANRMEDAGPEDLELGRMSYRDLPIHATSNVFLALVASTLTSVIVFLPIVFLNPQVRILYTGLSLTVISSQFISLLVGVTVIPCLASNVSRKWLQQSAFFSTYFWIYLETKIARYRSKANDVYFMLVRHARRGMAALRKTDSDLVHPVRNAPKKSRDGGGFVLYRRLVAKVMRRRYWVASLMALFLAGSLYLYGRLDKEFVGNMEENEFTIFVELPSGAKLDVSDKVVASVEKLLNDVPEIKKSVKTAVSRVEGWSSKIYVTLVPVVERTRTVQEVITYLRPLTAQLGQEFGGFIYFSEPSSSKEFLIDVYGYEYTKIRDIAVQIAQRLEKVPGLADIKLRYKPGRPELRAEIDRQKASLLGFTIHDIAETLHAQIRGLRATYFMTPTAEIETVARLKEEYRKTIDDVENLTFIDPRSQVVHIRQFTDFQFGLTPSEIYRKNRERMIQVSANRGEISLSKVGELTQNVLKGIKVPTGYYYEIGGDFPKLLETEKEFRLAFLMMVLLIYAILASTFESYLQPVIILVAVPLTLLGSIPLLYLTKTAVTIGALIGFIMLGGIAVNNSIMLVDVFNTLHKKKGMYRALLEAGQERLRPIVSTSTTNVLGMLPLLFQKSESGSLWTPLAMTIVGGLASSTILILFILPGFYLILNDVKTWCAKFMEKYSAV